MLRVISYRVAAGPDWLDEIGDVDWFDDDVYVPPGSFHRPEEETGHNISEDNLGEYLADDVDEEEDISEQPPVPEYMQELPTGEGGLLENPEAKPVEYSNVTDLVQDGIAKQEVISFEYVNRHGAYAGWRTVEPHYTFPAVTTGNTVLVSWDRGINDIRAFIVGRGGQPFVSKQTDPSAGIQSGGLRYEGETFELRPQIVSG